jgi:hypothetical protein
MTRFKLHSVNRLIDFKWMGITLLGILLLAFNVVSGQDTLSDKRIDVVKSYKPTTAEAVKINFNPEIPLKRQEFDPQVEYEVPNRPIRFGYRTTTIRALSMRKEDPLQPGMAYLKGGFGNYSTPLLEGYFNSGRSGKYQYGGWASHISSRGPLENQKYSDNNVHLFGKYFFNGHTLEADLDYHREVVHLYGYVDSVESYEADSVKQRYSTWSGSVGFQNHEDNQYNLDYNGNFDFYHLADRYGATEQSYDIAVSGSKTLENGDDVEVDLSVNPITFKTDSSLISPEQQYTPDSTLERWFVTLKPRFIFRKPEWKMKLQLGGQVTFVNEQPEFLPDIYLSRKLVDNHLIYYSGWEGRIIPNSYQQLTDRNPYLTPRVRQQYTRSLNSYTGVKGYFARNFFYKAEFAYKNISDKPLFINDSLDRKNFDVAYAEKASIFNFHVELGYQWEEKAKVALKTDYDHYDLITDFEKPWHVPQFRMTLSGHYNIQDKIKLEADIFALDRLYARVDGQAQRLPFIIDANISARYRYLDYLSFFLNIENVAGRYTRWYGYPTYGFHLIGGASLNF